MRSAVKQAEEKNLDGPVLLDGAADLQDLLPRGVGPVQEPVQLAQGDEGGTLVLHMLALLHAQQKAAASRRPTGRARACSCAQ